MTVLYYFLPKNKIPKSKKNRKRKHKINGIAKIYIKYLFNFYFKGKQII